MKRKKENSKGREQTDGARCLFRNEPRIIMNIKVHILIPQPNHYVPKESHCFVLECPISEVSSFFPDTNRSSIS